ncbi:hypothetical protein OH76DRAFT_1030586 [Lentinus brumalis]|uniref:Uncharacterized protein n=1 Tax=Lentinus brumalis TaxID=2498619 RepID=A0A371CXE7_9APHY|nr:hypothetical protein OH76DRAFT_1030586 [Polyporus brumalis]
MPEAQAMTQPLWLPVVLSRSWSAKVSSNSCAGSSAGTGVAMTKKASIASVDGTSADDSCGWLARACGSGADADAEGCRDGGFAGPSPSPVAVFMLVASDRIVRAVRARRAKARRMTTRTIAWGGTFPDTLHSRRASDSARQSQRGPSLSADGYRCVVASSSRLVSGTLAIVGRIGCYPHPDAAATLPLCRASSTTKARDLHRAADHALHGQISGHEFLAELTFVTAPLSALCRVRPLVPHYYQECSQTRERVTCVIVILSAPLIHAINCGHGGIERREGLPRFNADMQRGPPICTQPVLYQRRGCRAMIRSNEWGRVA